MDRAAKVFSEGSVKPSSLSAPSGPFQGAKPTDIPGIPRFVWGLLTVTGSAVDTGHWELNVECSITH
jgi:hypothetical protein